MKLYKIKDWDIHFENNRTREMKRLGWVPVPNKQDGDGFRAIMHHEDGLKIFGAWILLLQIASKCDPRGTLVRDNGLPHTERTIARMTGTQEGDIYIAIQYLASNDVDWLCYELVEIPQEGAGSPQEGAPIPQEPAENAPEWNGTEQNRKEQKAAVPPSAKTGPAWVVPPYLASSPEFMSAWHDWQEHRREIKSKLTPGAAKRTLAKFEDWGIARAVAAINHSIEQGWTGIYEPKTNNKSGPSHSEGNGDLMAAFGLSRPLTQEQIAISEGVEHG